jgi:hypothetical protein
MSLSNPEMERTSRGSYRFRWVGTIASAAARRSFPGR